VYGGDAVGLYCVSHVGYILCGHFTFCIFFSRVHTGGTTIFVHYDVCACVICTYNWNRIIACGIVGQTRSNCIYSRNPTQTNTNYYYHQTPAIFRSNSNAVHNLTTLLFIIFSVVQCITVFKQCLQNTRGSPPVFKSDVQAFHISLKTNHQKISTYNGSFTTQ